MSALRSLLAALAVLPLASAALPADDLISADRPDLANGTSTVGRGTFQIEAGLYRDHDEGDARGLATPFLLRYGIVDALELRVGGDGHQHFNADFSDEYSGWAPVSFGLKLRLAEETPSRPAVALIADASPPSGSGVFRSDRTTGDLALAADKSLGEHWTVTPNIGVAWLDGGDRYGTYAAFVAALTVQYSFRPSLAVFVDVALQAPEVPGESPVEIVDIGVEWIVGRNTQLDLSVGWGAGGASVPGWYWTAGVSRRF